MFNFGGIQVTLSERTAHAVTGRADPSGASDGSFLEDLERIVDWIEDDAPCDAILIHLPQRPEADVLPPPDIELCRKWEKLLVRIDRLACVSVAVIDGPCTRIWMQLALACDHRVATTRSMFQVHEVKEGYLPGMNVFRLAKYVGIGVARRFVFMGEAMSADSAASLGLVDHVCGSEELELVSRRIIARLRPIHPVAVQLARRLLNESFSTAFEQFLGQYLASQHRCLSKAEEAVTSSKSK